MHAMFFGIKRWHLQIVEASKRVLQPNALTPARFDLMRAIAARDGEIVQRSLQWLFGVSAATISRMVKGLEEKGFVKRSRLTRDRRFKNVTITANGYEVLNRDLEYCVESRINERLAAALVTEDPYANIDSASVRRRIERTHDHLVHGRRILRDRSPVRQPWARADFATLGSMALVHESNPNPLQRRGRVFRNGGPLPWEVAPVPRRQTVKAPRARRAQRGGSRFYAEIFEAFDRAEADGRAAPDNRPPAARADNRTEADDPVIQDERAEGDGCAFGDGHTEADDQALLARLAMGAARLEVEDRALASDARQGHDGGEARD